jgi:hypothetical protein
MEEGTLKVVKQATQPLPFLEHLQVPVLYVDGEPPYVPVFAVCRAIGIPPDPHIRRWRNLLLWETAQKLPFQTEKRGKRLVWCLSIAEIPFLYSLFNWELVTPAMRVQIKRAAKEGARLAGLAYQEMQDRYKSVRQLLFSFLSRNADLDGWFQRYQAARSDQLSSEDLPGLLLRLDQGRTLYQGAIDHARKMLRDMGELPVIDALVLDQDHTVLDTIAMPILPIIAAEDIKLFAAWLSLIATWHRSMERFGQERGE